MPVTRSGNLATGSPAVPGSTEASSLRYFQHDQLGSIAAVSNEAGAVIERLAYDPWGKRRSLNGTADVTDSLVGLTTDRGFTMHEHLDEMGVVHMNGRIYDPLIGRFMSADPIIQAPGMLQSHNRYAYVMNNPLNLTDPSGFSWWTRFRDKWVRPIVAIAVAVYAPQFIGQLFAGSAGLTGSAFYSVATTSALGPIAPGLTALGSTLAAAGGGFAAGLVGSGGDIKAGLQGALSGGVFGAIGVTGAANGWGTGAYVAAHAAGGCITSVAGGGSCGSGAASAAFGKFTTLAIGDMPGDFAKGVATVVAGGVGSVIAGGKFENGAVTAAYGYLFNQVMTANGMAMSGANVGVRGLWNRFLGVLSLPLSLTGDTPRVDTVFHYTTEAGYQGISASGAIRPSADGNVYLTPLLHLSGSDAQAKLALSTMPIGYFVIPKTDILPASAPSPVQPWNGQPGGGIEIKAPHPVPIGNAVFVRF